MRNFVSLRGSFDHSAARRGISPPAGGDLLFPWRKRRQNAPGDASDGLRLRCAPPRSIGRFPRTPFTGDALLLIYCWISGAQNLSGGSKFLPGHWALGVQNLLLVRFRLCASVYRTNAPSPFSAKGAAPRGRPFSFMYVSSVPIPEDGLELIGECSPVWNRNFLVPVL